MPFIRNMICKYFLPVCDFSFQLLNSVFWKGEVYHFDRVHIKFFPLWIMLLVSLSKKSLPHPRSQKAFLLCHIFKVDLVILGLLSFYMNFRNGLWISTQKTIALCFSCQPILSSSAITTSNLLLLISSLLPHLTSYFTGKTKTMRGEFSQLCTTKYTDSPFPDPLLLSIWKEASLFLSKTHPTTRAQTPFQSQDSLVFHYSLSLQPPSLNWILTSNV